mgnify:CR=1 FL=1
MEVVKFVQVVVGVNVCNINLFKRSNNMQNKELIKYLLKNFEEQIKICNFTDLEGHPLELNIPFLQLIKELHKEVD